ncbi:MAG TPA: NrfD/PsrC family molybdoenzyme membrane anchor subunit [Acetobacteraceae bacterium]|nr:NrfD/PsrC family molybdoenzyme membrane anchor subunit [Acetobacteraceae bacterium]
MPEGIDLGGERGRWAGRTYYGRPQVKPAPFENAVVGTYVFLAGLSGATQLLSSLLDLTRGPAAGRAVRRGRLLSMLAPTIGAACLIFDLHTPKRFYNMLRVAKGTSPMSIGTWILMAFSSSSALIAAAHLASDYVPGFRWLRSVARAAQVPAAAAGAGLSTYTAALLSATSTPLWAAAPKGLAVRFGASAIASGAAALGLGERRSRIGRDLDSIAIAALATELAATLASEERYRRTGVDRALHSTPGVLDQLGGTGIGVLLPLGLYAASLLLTRRRSRTLTTAASLAVLGGSLAMRIGVMAAGDESARRPEISMGFAQPENLPKVS